MIVGTHNRRGLGFLKDVHTILLNYDRSSQIVCTIPRAQRVSLIGAAPVFMVELKSPYARCFALSLTYMWVSKRLRVLHSRLPVSPNKACGSPGYTVLASVACASTIHCCDARQPRAAAVKEIGTLLDANVWRWPAGTSRQRLPQVSTVHKYGLV